MNPVLSDVERKPTRPPLRSIPRLLSCIRFDEVCLLQGAPLIGALFAVQVFTGGDLFKLAALIAGNLCLVAHIFLLNDWAGIRGDLRDPNRAARTYAAKGVSPAAVGGFTIGLLAVSLAVFGAIGSTTLALGAAIAALSALYSAPGIHWKGTPVLGSALHIVGGALHFLLGYATFAPIDSRGLGISCFFALVFTAGHLTNEARDHDGDASNGIRTNAVVFGKAASFLAGLAVFTVAYALLVQLALLDILPRACIFAAALYPLHLLASLRAYRAGLTFQRVRQLQWVYRAIFAVIGVVMIATMPLWS